jgi:hypothetical protein
MKTSTKIFDFTHQRKIQNGIDFQEIEKQPQSIKKIIKEKMENISKKEN